MHLASVSRAAFNSLLVLGSHEKKARLSGGTGQLAFIIHSRAGGSWTAKGGPVTRRPRFRAASYASNARLHFRDAKPTRRVKQSMDMSTGSVAGAMNEAASGICAEVVTVPTLSDNYAYLLIDPTTGKAACVDPAEPRKIMEAAKERGVNVSAVLCTHKHWDHSSGNEEMKKQIPDLEVVSSAYEDEVPAVTVALKDEEEYSLGSLKIRSLHTPCHTRGHVMFFVSSISNVTGLAPLVFTGDTLFIGGCGRFFEGDASEMSQALQGVAARLPAETRVFCGHEYTVSNLQFAKSIEAENTSVVKKLEWSRKILADGGYTVPSTIAQELKYNPFMRVDEDAVRKATGASDSIGTMARLREMKNRFRPPP